MSYEAPDAGSSASSESVEGFGARLGLLAKDTAHYAGPRVRSELLDAAYRHAKVFGLDHDDDAAGIDRVAKAFGDLACEPFLQLESPRV